MRHSPQRKQSRNSTKIVHNRFSLCPRAVARSAARAKPGARLTNSEMRKSSAILCWFGLDVRLLADVIEFRGFFKINVMESVGKQIEIIIKQ